MEQQSRDSVRLRSGVAWPMWSEVTDATAREALDASLAASGWLWKWAGFEPDEDRVWRAILSGFARTGQAQGAASLGAATGLDATALAARLRALGRRDMLVLDETALRVDAAYPFCAWPTGHRVAIAGSEAVSSLCAIDALGAGAMLGRDTVVHSTCRQCGRAIELSTRDGGHALDQVNPSTAIVWAGQRYANGCSATSACTLKVFFCSEAHLTTWRERADHVGFALAPEAALQMGRALFRSLLMPER